MKNENHKRNNKNYEEKKNYELHLLRINKINSRKFNSLFKDSQNISPQSST